MTRHLGMPLIYQSTASYFLKRVKTRGVLERYFQRSLTDFLNPVALCKISKNLEMSVNKLGIPNQAEFDILTNRTIIRSIFQR